MEKQEFLDKTVEALKPFETQNLMTTIQTQSLTDLFTNWVFLLASVIFVFFGIYKRSKTVLTTFFLLVGMIIIAKYTLPPPGTELTMSSLLPFVGGCLGVGCVMVYCVFIRD